MASITYRGLWRWHFHAGVLCIPFVVVLALTGSIFLFKPQIDAFADRGVDSLALAHSRATGERHIEAALAAVPGSKLFAYEVPREPDDAVRVHVYSADGTGRIVYVHPESLAILKAVPHASRFTEIVRMIHASLLAGRTGAVLIELAASWAIVMLITGVFLWWPRDGRGLAGVAWPRWNLGRRVFWRDLHAVTGVWISCLAMFLLITALPWTTVAGEGIGKIRGWVAPAPQDWAADRTQHPAGHVAPEAARATATRLTVDDVIARIAPLRLEPPVRLYLPNENQAFWRVRAETQNRPKVRELEIDAATGALLREPLFADKSVLDRAIHVGIAAHEGQLFGVPNQALGLFTASGLLTLCVSAVVMWWRRRPGSLGIPAARAPGFRIHPALRVAILVLGVALPLLGASLVALWILDRITRSRRIDAVS
jgi:uncharacterized iron-regulated membrane protein